MHSVIQKLNLLAELIHFDMLSWRKGSDQQYKSRKTYTIRSDNNSGKHKTHKDCRCFWSYVARWLGVEFFFLRRGKEDTSDVRAQRVHNTKAQQSTV